jgi:hypothetical protein
MGVGRGPMVEARFRLTDAPIMILIDDPAQRVDWPMAPRYLFDDLSQELLKRGGASKIVPLQTVNHLRQSVPDFEKRGCREVGKLGNAEQVLWIQVQDFFADQQIQEADVAAYFTVTVKVINVLERRHRARVRLWPPSAQGHLLSASMTGSEVALVKTKDAICKDLTGRLAVKIARLFHDHRADDFRRQP